MSVFSFATRLFRRSKPPSKKEKEREEAKVDLVVLRYETGDHGTFGTVLGPDGWTAHSLEPPWLNNEPNYSCIPEGIYRCVYTFSPAFKRYLYLVEDVPGRSGIRIHSGNLAGNRKKGLLSHSYGCILLGSWRGRYKGQEAVMLSEPKVRELREVFDEEPFWIEIKDLFRKREKS